MLTHIGIVGAGASAVCLLDALAERSDLPPGRLTVFEPADTLWRGRAYQPDLDSVQVNAPPADMSVRGRDPAHFHNWLGSWALMPGSHAAFADPFSGITHIPRALYGDYLEQSARAALMSLALSGWVIELVRERVEAADMTAGGVTLRSEQRAWQVSLAVLCVGGGPPADHHQLAGAPGYIADPYPVGELLAEVDPEADVGVIGTGLTAVDVVMALTRSGHRGSIRLLSRTGVLPAVRQPSRPYRLQHFTADRFSAAREGGERCSLEDVVALMRAELSAAGEDPSAISSEIAAVRAEHPVDRLRRQLREIDSPGLGLRILQQAVPEVGPDVWPVLLEQDKERLLVGHYRTIMSLCCPMSAANGSRLLSLIDAGQLKLVAGLRRIAPDRRHGFLAVADGGRYALRTVVNAATPDQSRVHPRANRLVTGLTGAGAERHARAGLSVEPTTSRVIVSGKPDDRLFALGDLASGTLFFTFGMQSLVDRAGDIADAIAVRAAPTHPAAVSGSALPASAPGNH